MGSSIEAHQSADGSGRGGDCREDRVDMTVGATAETMGGVLNKRYVQGIISTADFKLSDFFQQTSRFAPADLERILELLAEELQQELTGIVNQEFEGFTQLFNSIGDVGQEELISLCDKVRAVAMAIKDVKDVTNEELTVVEARIEDLHTNIRESKRLEFNLGLLASLDRLKECLQMMSEGPDRLHIDLASEFFMRIMLLVNAASGKIELDDGVKERLADYTEKFFSGAEDALLASLRAGDISAWETVAGIYIRLGKTSLLREIISTVLVKPALETLLAKSVFDEARKKIPEQAVPILFEKLLSFIKDIQNRWFTGIARAHPNVVLFVDAVLANVFSGLTHSLPTIFSPAIPDAFHKNFTTSCNFVGKVVELLTPTELVALDGHQNFKTYAGSWQLNVYFQLRFRDFAQSLEDLLQWGEHVDIFARDLSKEPTDLTHPVVIKLEQACRDLVSEKILLKPLIPRFVKLRLQAISRVANWFYEQFNVATSDNVCQAYRAVFNHQKIHEMVQVLLGQDISWLSPLDLPVVTEIQNRFIKVIHTQNTLLKVKLEELMVEGVLKKISEQGEFEPTRFSSSIRTVEEGQSEKLLSKSTKRHIIEAIIKRFLVAAQDRLVKLRKAVSNERRLKAIMKDLPIDSRSTSKSQEYKAVLMGLAEESQRLLNIAEGHELAELPAQLQTFLSSLEKEKEQVPSKK